MPERMDHAGRVPKRPLGLIPATRRSRLLYAWGLATFVLTMLPVWGLFANSGQVLGGILPATVLWSYAVFAAVNLLAVTLYVVAARPWAEAVDEKPDLVGRHEAHSRREQVFEDLARHERRAVEDAR